MIFILVIASVISLVWTDVSHLTGSRQYLPPQPTGGYIGSLQRPEKDYLPPVQPSLFSTGPQAPIFSPPVPVQRNLISPIAPYQPISSFRNPPPVFSPTVPNYVQPLQPQIQYAPPIAAPLPTPLGIGSFGSSISTNSFGGLGQTIYQEPPPAHTLGPDGYNYRRPIGAFNF